MNYHKALLGTVVLIILHDIGLVLALSTKFGFLKMIGVMYYFITAIIVFFITYQYMNSPFYKELGVRK